jgi:hypothetical protein
MQNILYLKEEKKGKKIKIKKKVQSSRTSTTNILTINEKMNTGI